MAPDRFIFIYDASTKTGNCRVNWFFALFLRKSERSLFICFLELILNATQIRIRLLSEKRPISAPRFGSIHYFFVKLNEYVFISFVFFFFLFFFHPLVSFCTTFQHRQPLRLDIKRRLTSRSDRVKSVDLHPTEPWMLCALYNGHVHVMNYENQQLFKDFEVRVTIKSVKCLSILICFGKDQSAIYGPSIYLFCFAFTFFAHEYICCQRHYTWSSVFI